MTMITPSAQLTLTKGNKSWSSTAVAAALELVDPLGSGPWLSLTAAAFFFFFFFFIKCSLFNPPFIGPSTETPHEGPRHVWCPTCNHQCPACASIDDKMLFPFLINSSVVPNSTTLPCASTATCVKREM
eukprot:FR736707.1.p2 GENE.FR736707.1~~FR736707.1.p2  ORF type:complete len:129 (-),score=22.01 FR736707.1:339-725(-)